MIFTINTLLQQIDYQPDKSPGTFVKQMFYALFSENFNIILRLFWPNLREKIAAIVLQFNLLR